MLTLKHVSFGYGDDEQLHDISFTIKKGETIGIVGPSGGGKSTLLKLMAGHLDPLQGTTTFEKKKLPKASQVLIPGHEDIQLVNQDYKLDVYHTVRENLFVQAMHLPKNEAHALVDETLDFLELTHLSNQKAISISGGEQQRLALGRALCKEPKILLLDEPFAHLDVHLRYSLTHYLKKLQKVRKTGLVLVSHNGQEIMQFSDRIFYLESGKIQREGNATDFYNFPTNKREGLYFGELNAVHFQRKEVLFRPHAYALELTEKYTRELVVTFKQSYFAGFYIENHFVHKKETLIVYSQVPLKHVEKIYI
jgi:iron(III) transport system ATP-binding protein